MVEYISSNNKQNLVKGEINKGMRAIVLSQFRDKKKPIVLIHVIHKVIYGRKSTYFQINEYAQMPEDGEPVQYESILGISKETIVTKVGNLLGEKKAIIQYLNNFCFSHYGYNGQIFVSELAMNAINDER